MAAAAAALLLQVVEDVQRCWPRGRANVIHVGFGCCCVGARARRRPLGGGPGVWCGGVSNTETA
jgi:hypothetical protein